VSSTAGLEDTETWKFLILQEFNSELSVAQLLGSRYTDCATVAPTMEQNNIYQETARKLQVQLL
jgi:hypothetical protein